MKIKLPEIDPKRFYQVGKFAFYTMGLIGLIRIVDLWGELASYDIFSSFASAIFYLVLAGFFAGLQSKEDIKEVNDGDIIKMNDALEKLNLEDKKNAKKK
jgi:predicted membrane channel-forming protein YqfA (hemolysin III family)